MQPANSELGSSSPSSNTEEGLPLLLNKDALQADGLCRSGKKVEASTNKAVGRFAPTPSGKLHLGNLFSFLVAYIHVKQNNGSMLLRIEDLDPARSKQQYVDAVFRDLDALGFEWDGSPVYQSQRTDAYEAALAALQAQNLLYPCYCSRADLHAANAPHFGEEVVYQGTCKAIGEKERLEKASKRNPSIRIAVSGNPISFIDAFQGEQSFNLMECSGDFVVRRSDGVFAYQLAVVVDDAWMGVTSVVRGCDLITSTPRQIYLQRLLGFPTPSYGHIPLIVSAEGKRLAKRDKSTDIDFLLNEQGISASVLLGKVAYASRLIDADEPMALPELVRYADLSKLKGVGRVPLPGPTQLL